MSPGEKNGNGEKEERKNKKGRINRGKKEWIIESTKKKEKKRKKKQSIRTKHYDK